MNQYTREHGLLLTLAHAWDVLCRRLRDRILSRRLNAHGFRAGRHPRIRGLAYLHLGSHVHAADDLWLEAIAKPGMPVPQLTLGDNVWMSDRVHVACLNRVTIGAGTLMGSGCLISDHTHGAYSGEAQSAPDVAPALRPLHSSGEIHIGRNVWMGDNVVVLPGAEIGDGAVIGAGSLVNGPIPAATVAVGTPARVVRRWDPEQRQWVRTVD